VLGEYRMEKLTERKYPIIDTEVPLKNIIILFFLPIFIDLGLLSVNSYVTFTSYIQLWIFVGVIPLFLYLVSFVLVGKQPLRSLFQKIKISDIGIAFFLLGLIFIYNLFSDQILAFINVIPTTNSAASGMAKGDIHQYGMNAIGDVFNLFNEEISSILTFLTSAAIVNRGFKLSRGLSFTIAMFFSVVIFGMMHFQSYSWNIPQMLISIGMLRFFFTPMYLRSGNILLPFMMHYIYDFSIFSLVFFS
jgi:CAAX amino terminal protease family.